MQKKDTLGSASAKSLNEAFKCGECLHFKVYPHSAHDDVCSKEGVKAVGIAPRCYTPDVTQIAQNTDQFVQVVQLFQSFDYKQRRIFLAALRNPKKRKHKMGTKLYFKVGRDYISNYLCGYVAGYSSTGELMLMGSPDQKTRGRAFMSYMDENSEDLMTYTEWKIKRKQLRDANKVIDPSGQVIQKTAKADEAYEPPTLDSAPAQWFDKQLRQTKRRTAKTDTYDFQVS